MDNKHVYLTKDGLAEIKREYEVLTKVKRPVAVERLAAARAQGDLSENSEYTAARDELSFIDGRIEELEEILKHVEVIRESHTHSKHAKVKLGSKVTVTIKGKKEIFTLVGEWEADPINKKISHQSPLGMALIGKNIGEEVFVEAPAGKIKYLIAGIE